MLGSLAENTLWLAIGAAISWLVSAYYFQRGAQIHRLSIAVIGQSTIVNHPAAFATDVAVTFRGKPIRELYQTMILIGNSGTVSLSHPPQPIRVHLPSNAGVIEAEIDTTSPGRIASILSREIVSSNYDVGLTFDVLNRNEFALIRVLSERRFGEQDVVCETSIPELPATIKATDFKQEWLYEEKPPKLKSRLAQGIYGVGLLFVGISMLFGAFAIVAETFDPALGFVDFRLWALYVSAVAVLILAISFGVVGGGLFGSAFAVNMRFGKHRPFFDLRHLTVSTRLVGRAVA